MNPWCFSSRTNTTTSAYNIQSFIQELSETYIERYVIIEHAGHGANSYALHYYMVDDHYALFLQLPWGGIYSNRDEDTKRIRRSFRQAWELVEIVRKQTDSEVTPTRRRLVVVESGFYESQCGWQMRKRTQEIEWLENVPPMGALQRALDAVKNVTGKKGKSYEYGKE